MSKLSQLSLAAKFNVVFLAVFVVGFIATSVVSNFLLQKSAREETMAKAGLLMGAALASRTYTSKQILPLLESRLKFEFVPQSIPSFGATEQLNQLLKAYPGYSYKEATLNPTNLRDLATPWEAAVVRQLRAAPTAEVTGQHDGPGGPSLYMARPLQINDPACLSCHSTPDAAPKTMLDVYGRAHGFGWQLHEVIGAQVVSVPLALATQRADQLLRNYMLSMLGIFVFLFCALNAMVHLFVTRRLRQMSTMADQISLGATDVGEIDVRGSDELATLAQSFGRMRTSLVSAMKMLEE